MSAGAGGTLAMGYSRRSQIRGEKKPMCRQFGPQNLMQRADGTLVAIKILLKKNTVREGGWKGGDAMKSWGVWGGGGGGGGSKREEKGVPWRDDNQQSP